MHTKLLRLLALLGGVCAVPVTAQQGSIAGRITDKVTQQPIQGAQVLVQGTNLQASSNQDGRYRVERVPAGTYQVQIRLIGYAFGQQAVTVAAGDTATLDLALTAVAIPLEALVVTATGEEQRVKELGNAVTNIQASKITEEAPVNTVADLLNARAPGVQVITSGGTTGSGSRIRIRGASSLSLTNEPIVVVDGVRVDNNPNSGLIGGLSTTGGQIPSRLNDFSPGDIEDIEVVKGPSAAARSICSAVISRPLVPCPVRGRFAVEWAHARETSGATARTTSHGRCRIMRTPRMNATACVDYSNCPAHGGERQEQSPGEAATLRDGSVS